MSSFIKKTNLFKQLKFSFSNKKRTIGIKKRTIGIFEKKLPTPTLRSDGNVVMFGSLHQGKGSKMTDKLLENALKFRAKTPTQKLILLVMASHIDAKLKCKICRNEIAELSRCSLKTVARCIEELKAAGLVETRGHNIIMIDDSAKARSKTRYDEEFEGWWKAYPRKKNTSKLMAFRAFAKVMKSGVIEYCKLMNITRVFGGLVQDTNSSYIPHPATWLNQHRFDTVDDEDKKKRESLNTLAG